MVSHYEVLGVEPTAEVGDIRHAWRVKIRLLHPDLHRGSPPDVQAEAASQTHCINRAWETLRDPEDEDAPLVTNEGILFSRYLSSEDWRRVQRRSKSALRASLWVCNVSGGPYQFTATKPGKTALGLEEAHRDLRISPAEFDEVAAELGRTLDFAKVPKPEKAEVLAAFAAHKDEVTAGYVADAKRS